MSVSKASEDDFNTYAPGHMPMPDFEALARDIQNRASCRGSVATTETRHFREFFGTSVLFVGGTPPSRGDRGGARRLVEFLGGVRKTSSEAERYKVGWTKLSMGGRKRRAKASAAGHGTGSRGQAQARWMTVTAGDRMTALRMPLHCVSERGVSPPSPRQLLCTHGRQWLEGGDKK